MQHYAIKKSKKNNLIQKRAFIFLSRHNQKFAQLWPSRDAYREEVSSMAGICYSSSKIDALTSERDSWWQ